MTDSVAPAAAPVKMANIWVLGRCPLSVKYAPHHPGHQRGSCSAYGALPFAPTTYQLRAMLIDGTHT
jgi:hypothetical protein